MTQDSAVFRLITDDELEAANILAANICSQFEGHKNTTAVATLAMLVELFISEDQIDIDDFIAAINFVDEERTTSGIRGNISAISESDMN